MAGPGAIQHGPVRITHAARVANHQRLQVRFDGRAAKEPVGFVLEHLAQLMVRRRPGVAQATVVRPGPHISARPDARLQESRLAISPARVNSAASAQHANLEPPSLTRAWPGLLRVTHAPGQPHPNSHIIQPIWLGGLRGVSWLPVRQSRSRHYLKVKTTAGPIVARHSGDGANDHQIIPDQRRVNLVTRAHREERNRPERTEQNPGNRRACVPTRSARTPTWNSQSPTEKRSQPRFNRSRIEQSGPKENQGKCRQDHPRQQARVNHGLGHEHGQRRARDHAQEEDIAHGPPRQT